MIKDTRFILKKPFLDCEQQYCFPRVKNPCEAGQALARGRGRTKLEKRSKKKGYKVVEDAPIALWGIRRQGNSYVGFAEDSCKNFR